MTDRKRNLIPHEVNRCRACGDQIREGLKHCLVCENELKHGIIPPLKPGKMLGTGNSEPWKHDSAYHGDTNSGEF